MISQRVQKIDASGIRKVFELAAKMEDPVNLSIGQPDFDVPPAIKQAAKDSIDKGFNQYTLTQGIPELREKLAHHLNLSRNMTVSAQDILISSGVSGGLYLALLSIIDPGDEIIFFDPYFVMYKHLVNLLDGKPVILPTYPEFRIPLQALEKAITSRTKAVILNSPANPTGTIYPPEDIQAVVQICRKHNILLISDEIYDGFVYDQGYTSPAGSYDNLLLLGGFSKTYAMTGWRLGYVAGRPDLLEQMKKVQQYTFVCAPAPFQYAALTAMDTDMEEYRQSYSRKRDLVYQGLKDSFNIVKPGGAFYIFPGLKNAQAADASKLVEKSISRSVLIIPGNVFSERNSHFRISFAASDDKLQRGVEILNQIAREFQ